VEALLARDAVEGRRCAGGGPGSMYATTTDGSFGPRPPAHTARVPRGALLIAPCHRLFIGRSAILYSWDEPGCYNKQWFGTRSPRSVGL
jgi:hypothetical protein